jgi:dihydroorotase
MILEGHFVDAENDFGICQVEVENGSLITKVGKSINKKPDLSFGKDIVLVPGIIDMHTHLRYGEDYKEDINTGTLAAINGGVVRVMDMPNNPKGFAPVDSDSYRKKIIWARKGNIPVHLWAGVGPDTLPFDEAEHHYKVFMAESVGDLFFDDFETLDKTLANYKDQEVSFHCEDPGVIKEHANESTHEQRRPPISELAAVRNAIKLIRKYDLGGMIMHVSCSTSFAALDSAQARGTIIEVTPHHMLFNIENKNEMLHGELLKMNPPLRSEFDSKYLIGELTSGRIHHIGSDHAPHTLEEKLGKEDAEKNPKKVKNPSGIPGLDHMGQVLGYLHMDHKIPLITLNKLFSYKPAQYLGIRHGIFVPGYEASIIGIDIGSVHAVRSENVKTKAGYTAYEGMLLPNVPFVMAQGRIVKQDGKLTV